MSEIFFPCCYPVQIRFRDLDPLAHVNNTVYFIYFEEARSYYFDQLKLWLAQWPSEEEHQVLEENASERLCAKAPSQRAFCVVF
jgi:acyl-CoA thioester hydrolase